MEQNNTFSFQPQDKEINNIFEALTLDYDQIRTKQHQNPVCITKTCKTTTSLTQPCSQCLNPSTLQPQPTTHLQTPLCKKCKKMQAVLLNKNEQICRECLLRNIEYKARLFLQNKIKVNSKNKLLVCFSGGLNSICLVYILQHITNKYKKNPLFGPTQCIHIQQQSKLPPDYLQKFTQLTSFKLTIQPIQSIYGKQSNKSFQDISQLFSSFKANSNSIDLLVLFRNKLIIQYAREHQFDYILQANNSESLSSEIFKYFTKGVGGSIPELSASEDGFFQNPLSQHSLKQLQFYFHHHRLSKLSMLSQSDDLSNTVYKEIDLCLDLFVATLQQKYSHTAPAIVRASQKIKNSFEHEKGCKWCWLKHDRMYELCQKCTRLREYIKNEQMWKMMPQWTIL